MFSCFSLDNANDKKIYIKFMCPFSKEFSLLAKTFEYSDYLEDSDWKFQKYNLINASGYSDLLEDTEWGTRSDDLTIA